MKQYKLHLHFIRLAEKTLPAVGHEPLSLEISQYLTFIQLLLPFSCPNWQPLPLSDSVVQVSATNTARDNQEHVIRLNGHPNFEFQGDLPRSMALD